MGKTGGKLPRRKWSSPRSCLGSSQKPYPPNLTRITDREIRVRALQRPVLEKVTHYKTPPPRTQKSSFGPPLLPPSLSLFHLLLHLLPLPMCPVCVPVCLAGCSTVSNACVPSSGHSSRSMQEPCGRRTGISRARVVDQHLYRLEDRALGPPPLLTWRSRLRHTTRPPGFETEFLAFFASLRARSAFHETTPGFSASLVSCFFYNFSKQNSDRKK